MPAPAPFLAHGSTGYWGPGLRTQRRLGSLDTLRGTYIDDPGDAFMPGDAVPDHPGMIIMDVEEQDGGCGSSDYRINAMGSLDNLDPRKVISTGDGGMITTRHAGWDRRFRLLRQHAMDVPDTVRHSSVRVICESYPVVGYNYRLTDIQAAVGREQLKRLPTIVTRRRELAAAYRRLLGTVAELKLPVEPEWARTNWQSYCVRLREDCDQLTVMQAMLDAGVATRRGVMCAHREPAYSAISPRFDLTRSELAQDQCILLPLYPQMTEDDQRTVASALVAACATASASSRHRSHRHDGLGKADAA